MKKNLLAGLMLMAASTMTMAVAPLDDQIVQRSKDALAVCAQFPNQSCRMSDDILANSHYTVTSNLHHNGNHETNIYLSSQVAKMSDKSLVLSVHSVPAHSTYNCADSGEGTRLCDYMSGRVDTKGLWSTKGVSHGYIEVIATMPVSVDGANERDELFQGMWPAIWMLPTDQGAAWPVLGGEIDIVELMGLYSSRALTTLHYGNAVGRTDYADQTFAQNPLTHEVTSENYSHYHMYGLEWNFDANDPYLATWYDGQMVASRHLKVDDLSRGYKLIDIFQKGQVDGFYLILNIATGGNFGATTLKTSNGSGLDANNPLLQMKVKSIRSYTLQ